MPVRADWVETVDDYGSRLLRALRRNWMDRNNRLKAQKLPSLQSVLAPAQQGLDRAALRLPRPEKLFEPQQNALTRQSSALLSAMRFTKQRQLTQITSHAQSLSRLGVSAGNALARKLENHEKRLERAGKLLDAYSYQGVLDRGYALVRDDKGKVIRSKSKLKSGQKVDLVFADGEAGAVIDPAAGPKTSSSSKKAKPVPAKPGEKNQGQLF